MAVACPSAELGLLSLYMFCCSDRVLMGLLTLSGAALLPALFPFSVVGSFALQKCSGWLLCALCRGWVSSRDPLQPTWLSVKRGCAPAFLAYGIHGALNCIDCFMSPCVAPLLLIFLLLWIQNLRQPLTEVNAIQWISFYSFSHHRMQRERGQIAEGLHQISRNMPEENCRRDNLPLSWSCKGKGCKPA